MKIEAVGHVIITRDPETKKQTEHKPGVPFEADEKEAAQLLAMGVAKKAVVPNQDEMDNRRRKSMESDAVQKKLGTPEEIAKLSDADLEDLLKKPGGSK
jgi:hypothetical protein